MAQGIRGRKLGYTDGFVKISSGCDANLYAVDDGHGQDEPLLKRD